MVARINVPGVSREWTVRLRAIRNSMIQRCHSVTNCRWKWYGGRGIVVCDEWLQSREAFIAWAVRSGYQPGLQIDRRDNDGNYDPENCRWVTHNQNVQNRGKWHQGKRMSQFKGVSRTANRGGKPWRACIRADHVRLHIGVFDTEEEAARAYDAKAIELHGEFARLNFERATA